MKQTFFIIIFTLITVNVFAQKSNKIFTTDIDHFWLTYDSIQKVNDFSRKLNIINTLYIDKGSRGLKTFMELRGYTDTLYVQLIEDYPKFWNSVRPNTLSIKNKTAELVNAVEQLHKLYPDLKDAQMYFTIGGLRSGGTVAENMVLVGAEIATADSTTDASEFKNNWLKNVFAEQSVDNIISLNIHEYIHTQQKPNKSDVLLNQTIREGACDFIAELALEKSLQRKYITYGRERFQELKQQFKDEMFTSNWTNWLYNGGQKGESADLGYFMGYEICKSYYKQAKDKSQAIREIIELDYSNEKAIELFLKKSGFYENGFSKEKLIKEYEKKLPFIVKIEPFENGADNVASTLKEFRITFSREMDPKSYSINYSDKGKEAYPIKNVTGFDNNNKTFVIGFELQPDKEYEFIINGGGFNSKDGYPLRDGQYLIKFKTN